MLINYQKDRTTGLFYKWSPRLNISTSVVNILYSPFFLTNFKICNVWGNAPLLRINNSNDVEWGEMLPKRFNHCIEMSAPIPPPTHTFQTHNPRISKYNPRSTTTAQGNPERCAPIGRLQTWTVPDRSKAALHGKFDARCYTNLKSNIFNIFTAESRNR